MNAWEYAHVCVCVCACEYMCMCVCIIVWCWKSRRKHKEREWGEDSHISPRDHLNVFAWATAYIYYHLPRATLCSYSSTGLKSLQISRSNLAGVVKCQICSRILFQIWRSSPKVRTRGRLPSKNDSIRRRIIHKFFTWKSFKKMMFTKKWQDYNVEIFTLV